jgi:hypothetical protein
VEVLLRGARRDRLDGGRGRCVRDRRCMAPLLVQRWSAPARRTGSPANTVSIAKTVLMSRFKSYMELSRFAYKHHCMI